MKIIVGSDHAALDLRPKVVEYLISKGHEVVDSGTHRDRANYAVEGFKVAEIGRASCRERVLRLV